MSENSFHELDFISYTDYHNMISRLKPGESLVVTCVEPGKHKISTGKIKEKDTKIVGRTKPGMFPDNFDTDGREKMRTASVANPAIVMGFKSSWEQMLYSPVNRSDIIVDWFMDELNKLIQQELSQMGNPDRFEKRVVWDLFEKKYREGYAENRGKLSYKIIHKGLDKYVEITISGFSRKGSDMTVGFSVLGNALYFVYDGKFSQL
jgi:hypothetical protein